jgi:predicted nucleotidyltransferase
MNRMVTAQDLVQTMRARSAERRVKAEARAARLRAHLPQARQLLIEQYQASRVVLFGSLATGTYSEQSDVDLAVEGLPSDLYFHALADLMALFGVPVDLVRLEEAAASLQAHIEEEGQPL